MAKGKISISRNVKLTVSHIEGQCIVFVVFVCCKCKPDQHIRFGEAGVAVSWLRGTVICVPRNYRLFA